MFALGTQERVGRGTTGLQRRPRSVDAGSGDQPQGPRTKEMNGGGGTSTVFARTDTIRRDGSGMDALTVGNVEAACLCRGDVARLAVGSIR